MNAQPNGTQAESGGDGGGLLALICGSLCKDTPFAETFGPTQNDNLNNNTAQPLMAPIQNGEHFRMRAQSTKLVTIALNPLFLHNHRILVFFVVVLLFFGLIVFDLCLILIKTFSLRLFLFS